MDPYQANNTSTELNSVTLTRLISPALLDAFVDLHVEPTLYWARSERPFLAALAGHVRALGTAEMRSGITFAIQASCMYQRAENSSDAEGLLAAL